MTSQQTPDMASPELPPAGSADVDSPGADTLTDGFQLDAGPSTVFAAMRGYLRRVRGGEVGALPAIFGLFVLVVVFTSTSNRFLTVMNLANLPAQAAGYIILAMGLVFVLLLGEIDLSAGTASGVCAATMGLTVNHGGHLRDAVGGGTYAVIILAMLIAAGIAAVSRLWYAVGIILLGLALLVTAQGSHVLIAMFLAVATGVAIGVLTGFLVARIGIPSFVVTLALFLGWQGVLLKYIGLGGAISVRDYSAVNGLVYNNLSNAWGWAIYVVCVGGYAAYTLWRSVRRRREGLSAAPPSLVLARAAGLAVLGGLAVFFLSLERSPNPDNTSIRGVPVVVLVIIVVMVFWTLVLAKSAFGRHLYAAGGNAEATRRAGINVPRMRIAAFAVGSGMAGLAGIAFASRLGSVPADAGAGNTLLYAVGAAVIGGTSLFGGRGKVRDGVIGGLVIAIIPNGLGLLGLGSAVEFMVTGLVLLAAAGVDALSRKRAAQAGL